MKRFTGIVMLVALLFGCDESILFEDAVAEPALKSAVAEVVVPDDYATIQEAVNAAEDGATIIIKEGTYVELVKILFRNDLTLIGQNAVLCPPEGSADPDRSIDIEESSNITIKNLKFDGLIETQQYPLYCAIGFTNSSGEASYNTMTGYAQGVVSWYQAPEADALPLKVSNNTLTDCMSGFEIQGNYDVLLEQNKVTYEYTQSRVFDDQFPFWHGILMEGGTGTISKNLIKFRGGSEFLVSSVGVRLMKRDPAPHLAGEMKDMHDVIVEQNIINRTDAGIIVNSDVPFQDKDGNTLSEEWCVYGIQLLKNTFVQVENSYDVFNECEEVVIVPPDN